MDEKPTQPQLADDIVLKESVAQEDSDPILPVSSDFNSSVGSGVKHKFRPDDPVCKTVPSYTVPAKHGVFVSICTALICFALGATTALYCFSSAYAWPWQMEWPAVEGPLTDVQANSKSARFSYSYEAGGREYHSSVRLGGTFAHTLKAGQKVLVRHHPTRLNESAMQAGFNVIETPFLILVSLGLFFVSWMFASMRLIEPKAKSSTETEPSPEIR